MVVVVVMMMMMIMMMIMLMMIMMGLTLTGHSNQHRSFSTKYLQFMDSLRATCIFVTGQ
jgi:hypothetical protein